MNERQVPYLWVNYPQGSHLRDSLTKPFLSKLKRKIRNYGLPGPVNFRFFKCNESSAFGIWQPRRHLEWISFHRSCNEPRRNPKKTLAQSLNKATTEERSCGGNENFHSSKKQNKQKVETTSFFPIWGPVTTAVSRVPRVKTLGQRRTQRKTKNQTKERKNR